MGHADSDVNVLSPRSEYPYSLLIVALLVAVGWIFIFVPRFSWTPLRVVTSVPLLLFAPGYAILAALAPERKNASSSSQFREIDGIERVTYSVVISLIVVPLLGFTLNFTPRGVRLAPVTALVGGLTLSAVFVGIYRWRSLPPSERFSLELRDHLIIAWDDLFAVRSSADYAMNAILVLALLIACGGIAYGVGTDAADDGQSELFVATESENGSLTLSDYPREFSRGEPRQLVLGLENQEGEQRSYTVAVVLQRIKGAAVIEREVLNRYEPKLETGEQWTQPTSIAPTMTGEHLQLRFEVYEGQPPSTLDETEADYTTHLWIDVSGSPQETESNGS